MPLYQEDLDQMQCGVPGCTHEAHDGLFLHAKCHPDSATWSEYKLGFLFITCATCNRPIGTIAVAPKERSHAQD